MSEMNQAKEIINCGRIDKDSIPWLSIDESSRYIRESVRNGQRVSAFFGIPSADGKGMEIYALLADDAQGRLWISRVSLTNTKFPALTPACPSLHLFERELAEEFGIEPVGHPWLKPVRFPQNPSGNNNQKPPSSIGIQNFYRVEGDEIHEVAVGPVHAGVIEPGHFRFQCFGEEVFHLEISLGYQHRGIERALIGGPDKKSLHYLETAAGDTTIGHGTAYCQLLETLSSTEPPLRGQVIRSIALELERLANHIGDMGALSGDTGFLPTASYCGRIRGDFLNMTAVLCGNRFGRGLNMPGGVRFDLDDSSLEKLIKMVETGKQEAAEAIELLWESTSVMGRFEGTGTLSEKTARQLGLVGPAARACGISRDIRLDHPSGFYRFTHIPISTWKTGDVFARAYVRWLEIQQSLNFILEQLHNLPSGPVATDCGELKLNQVAVSLVEGWRGEICHVAMTDEKGKISRYKIVDPSFHNWPGLAYALRNQQISDFPLCNKSFNLSYCGFDL